MAHHGRLGYFYGFLFLKLSVNNLQYIYAKKEKELCSVCGEKHIVYNDGLDYLDCILAYKLKEKKDYGIEIWDIQNRKWVAEKDWYKLK